MSNKINDTTDINIIPEKENNISSEEITAIAAAIYMYMEEVHDEESAVLTMGKFIREYSPWSAKIFSTYNFRGR